MFELTCWIVLGPSAWEFRQLQIALGGVRKPGPPGDEDKTADRGELLGNRGHQTLGHRAGRGKLMQQAPKIVDELGGVSRG